MKKPEKRKKQMNKKELIEKALNDEMVRSNLSKNQIDLIIKNNTRRKFDNLTVKKNHRKLLNIIKATAHKWQQVRTQKDVKKMIVTIDWKRGSMGAMQTKASAQITFKDGCYKYLETERTGGWGYDKESTSFSQLFNQVLQNKALNKRNKPPYGMSLKKGYWLPSFSYGVGVSCYFHIVKYLGGEMKQIANTNNINVYEIIF
jgi:hypothetical protein